MGLLAPWITQSVQCQNFELAHAQDIEFIKWITEVIVLSQIKEQYWTNNPTNRLMVPPNSLILIDKLYLITIQLIMLILIDSRKVNQSI